MADNATLEYIVLGFLGYGEATGYELKQHICNSVGNFYSASYGSIYPILKKLEEKALATSRECVERGKQKKIYSLTDAGRAAIIQWLMVVPKTMGCEMLVKMQFYHFLNREQITSLISQFIPNLIEQKENLERIYEGFADTDPIKFGTLQFGCDNYRFLIEWFQTYLRRVEESGDFGDS
ncbi:MAG TPA: PadR family transcriptional regulator [Bacillota bacterium]|nr:PadR family transcriptional regulator [Bacillota bacterium]